MLDDEEETAEGEKEGNEVEDEELDPLDAYMEEVKEEVKKFNMRSVKGGGGSEKVKPLVKYFLLLKDGELYVLIAKWLGKKWGKVQKCSKLHALNACLL